VREPGGWTGTGRASRSLRLAGRRAATRRAGDCRRAGTALAGRARAGRGGELPERWAGRLAPAGWRAPGRAGRLASGERADSGRAGFGLAVICQKSHKECSVDV